MHAPMQKILGTARLYWLEFLRNMKKVAFKEDAPMQKILGTARLYWLEFLRDMKKVAFKEEFKQ